MIKGWVPIPGSVQGRLVLAALHSFEQHGYEQANVTDLAAKAGVTTGALYHHFGSKLGLYTVVRGDLEKRIDERMQGALAVGERDRRSLLAALEVGLDAAVRFDCCRIVGEPYPDPTEDPFVATLQPAIPAGRGPAAPILVAAWRATLLVVAAGTPASQARRALGFALDGSTTRSR